MAAVAPITTSETKGETGEAKVVVKPSDSDSKSGSDMALGADGGLSLDDVTGNVKLTSKDKKEYDVDKKCALVSGLVKTSLETDREATEVPIPGVASAILAEIVTYMNIP